MPIGLLSASIQSVLSQLQRTRAANEEQKRIIKKAIELTTDIQAGEIKRPPREECISLPRPDAAKARRFAVRAWTSLLGAPGNGQKAPSEFDRIIDGYLKLFQHVYGTGELRPEDDKSAIEARNFFRMLNRTVVGSLNDLSGQRAGAEALARSSV